MFSFPCLAFVCIVPHCYVTLDKCICQMTECRCKYGCSGSAELSLPLWTLAILPPWPETLHRGASSADYTGSIIINPVRYSKVKLDSIIYRHFNALYSEEKIGTAFLLSSMPLLFLTEQSVMHHTK